MSVSINLGDTQVRGTYGTMYYVQNMAKSVAYYSETLGIKPSIESEGWTEFDLGNHSLCLHACRPGATTASGGILIIKVSKIHDLVKNLKSRGIEFLSEIREVHPQAYSADFRDADGNVVSFYENIAAKS